MSHVHTNAAQPSVAPQGRSRIALSALDEAATIGHVLRDDPPTLPGVGSFEFVVVDDGGEDATSEIAAPAVLLSLFLLFHYLTTSKFSPHKWAGFTAAALGLFSLMMFYAGVIGDMFVRHRNYLEELLYHAREENADRVQQRAREQLNAAANGPTSNDVEDAL